MRLEYRWAEKEYDRQIGQSLYNQLRNHIFRDDMEIKYVYLSRMEYKRMLPFLRFDPSYCSFDFYGETPTITIKDNREYHFLARFGEVGIYVQTGHAEDDSTLEVLHLS